MPHPQVVRIFVTAQEPDYDCPWQADVPSSSTGSGVIIGPHRILTGAHVVAHATFVQIQRISEPDKLLARLVAVSHDSDLALLECEEDLTADCPPAMIGELPDLRDAVSVVGFPVGGEEVSITEGVVSRIEVQRYSHSQRSLLAVTVDAAINAGNSGGPVFRDGLVVGIAFQTLADAENIGEMVPTPLIQHFLAGVEAGRKPGIPSLGIITQHLENRQMRRHLELGDGQSGVLVCAVEHGGSSAGLLRPGDVITTIAGLPVSNNGTVRFRDRYRTRFNVVLCEHHVGDELPLRIVRDGKALELTIPLAEHVDLVPLSRHDREPSWFIYGGIVFQRLCRDYLTIWNDWWDKAPTRLLHAYYSGIRTEKQTEVVVVHQVLADALNVGYECMDSEIVAAVNGVAPRDMADFVRLVERCRDTLEVRTTSGALLVLDAHEVAECSPAILNRYHVTRDRSADLSTTSPKGH